VLHDGIHIPMWILRINRSTNTRFCIMFGTKAKDIENVAQDRKQPEREKIVAERLNGQAAILGCVALIGAYATTGQIIPGIF